METINTIAAARKALRGKLIFGNDTQIRAVRFLERAEEALEKYTNCKERHLDYAKYESSKFDSYCDCMNGFSVPEIEAARHLWKNL